MVMFKSALLVTAIVTSQQTTVDYKLYDDIYKCEIVAEEIASKVKEEQEIHCICVEVEDNEEKEINV